ncbi:MAG: hypothetical protein WA208_13645 [Thermoanaerobaculia bacterium]
MAISQHIDTRTARAIVEFLRADAEFAALTAGGTLIKFGSWFDRRNGAVSFGEGLRRIHVAPAAFEKTAGTGRRAWDYRFIIKIEYFSPRNELPAADETAATVFDEVKELVCRLHVGMVEKSPGRYEDPETPGLWLTLGIDAIECSDVLIDGESSAAVMREILVQFRTREAPDGSRVA